MDADGSHQPEQLHRLLDALAGPGSAGADLVVGSRWVPGGSVVNWPLRREVLSRGGNLYVRMLLGIGIRDATAGFRVFRSSALEKIDLALVESTGYVFQTDLVTRCLRAGLIVREVPISSWSGSRQLQDERCGGHRITAPDHALGPARASRPGAPRAAEDWEIARPVRSGVAACRPVHRHTPRRDLRDHPGRSGDRAVVDDPAPGHRQHPRLVADQARGARAWRALREALDSGRMPARSSPTARSS